MSASDIDRFFDQRQHTMSGTIDRNLPIAVTFTAEQWEAIARILSNGPYNVVAPLIAGIQQQCMRFAELPPVYTPANGEDRPGV